MERKAETEVNQQDTRKDIVTRIGAIAPALVGLTVMSNALIMNGYKMAYLGRYVTCQGKWYEIVDVFWKGNDIMAKLALIPFEGIAS